MVDGRLRLDQWQSDDGEKRSRLKVVIEGFEFLDSRQDPQSTAAGASAA
jgi:single-strand DNA-binding protein